MSNSYQYAQKLIMYRKKQRITQTELAKILSVKQHQISEWESGKFIPSTISQAKIDALCEPTFFEKIA